MPAKYHGKTHLIVGDSATVLHGDIAVSTGPDGRSVIRIRNDSTRVEKVLEFTSLAVRDCIKQFIDAAWEVHHQVEVPQVIPATVPTCICCKGKHVMYDRDGNTEPCSKCTA